MAITTNTFTINSGNVGIWTSTEVINQFEEAFSWLGWHGDTQTGYCVGLSTYSGGGTVGSVDDNYEDVRPVSTTGVGTDASFHVDRNDGVIRTIYVNRPGYGYTGGETVTLSAEDIGGSSNGATDVTLKPVVDGTVANSVGYAVTFTFEYNATGTDRNGAVSGQAATITIKEGDTLTLTNNQSSFVYGINIIWNGTSNTAAADTNRVFNVTGQENGSNSGGETTWTPLPGQAGTYFVRPPSFSYSTTSPKIIVLPADYDDITLTSVGSTTTFYDSQTVSGNDYGVVRHTIQSGKRFGDTYRSIHFQHDDANRIYISHGNAFMPSLSSRAFTRQFNYGGGSGYSRRFAGTRFLDKNGDDIFGFNSTQASSSWRFTSQTEDINTFYELLTGGNTNYQLNLNIYRSSLDPNFAVFSFKAPSLPNTHISGNNFGTFFFHNFVTDLWDLDNLFLGGLTQISGGGDGNNTRPIMYFTTYLAGQNSRFSDGSTTSEASKRTAEFGYAGQNYDSNRDSGAGSQKYVLSSYVSNAYPNTSSSNFTDFKIYYRNSNNAIRTKGGASELTGNYSISSDADFNAVIKGIPLNGNLIPSPYYLPDDFVLIDFDFGTPNANIQQGDTVTISGSEVYTVIEGSYNNTNASRTRGILFCARTV
jgi:hypothetical protein